MSKNYKKTQNKRNMRGSNKNAIAGRGNKNNAQCNKAQAKESTFKEQLRGADTKYTPNDPKFYYSDENFIKPFANIPFNVINGLSDPFYDNVTVNGMMVEGTTYEKVELTNGTLQVPGICVSYFIPSFGVSENPDSPINQAALKNYAFMRHDNSGSTNYDAVNYAQYTLAVAGLVPLLYHIRRAITSIGTYNPYSRYAPDTLVSAMGFDPDDLRRRSAEYIGRFNLLLAKFHAFHVPMNLKFIKRWEWMCSNVFVDRDSVKAQLYLFRPAAYYVYDETSSDTPKVVAKPLCTLDSVRSTNEYTCEHYLALVENALAKLYQSDSIGIMSGDTLKAYGMENMFTIPNIGYTDATLPTESMEALWQFNNIQTVPWCVPDQYLLSTTPFVEANDAKFQELVNTCTYQEVVDPKLATSYLKCTPAFKANTSPEKTFAKQLCQLSVMNVDKANPSFEDVLEITRTKTSCKYDQKLMSYALLDCGTEIYTHLKIYGETRHFHVEEINEACEVCTTYASQLPTFALAAFDWHPLQFVIKREGVGTETLNFILENIFGEIDNVTILKQHDLQRINTAILTDLFGLVH